MDSDVNILPLLRVVTFAFYTSKQRLPAAGLLGREFVVPPSRSVFPMSWKFFVLLKICSNLRPCFNLEQKQAEHIHNGGAKVRRGEEQLWRGGKYH